VWVEFYAKPAIFCKLGICDPYRLARATAFFAAPPMTTNANQLDVKTAATIAPSILAAPIV
jgi:hypothetical protein